MAAHRAGETRSRRSGRQMEHLGPNPSEGASEIAVPQCHWRQGSVTGSGSKAGRGLAVTGKVCLHPPAQLCLGPSTGGIIGHS